MTPANNPPHHAPYGTWPSPISAEYAATSGIRLLETRLDGAAVYWLEQRPQEQGRVVVMRFQQGQRQEITPLEFSVRSQVHEYGGGAYWVQDERVYFVNATDQRIYQQVPGHWPQAITPLDATRRYADLLLDSARQRLLAIQEQTLDHTTWNRLVAIDLASGVVTVLAQGDDFYASPALSPDGQRLAWLSWNHPDMPWDKTRLWLAEFAADGLFCQPPRAIADDYSGSIFQPQWSPQGQLYFISDITDGWALYHWQGEDSVLICPVENAEFGLPQWNFGLSTYGFFDTGLIGAYTQCGQWFLAQCTKEAGFKRLDLPFSWISSVRVNADCAVFIAASPTAAAAVVQLDYHRAAWQIVVSSQPVALDTAYISSPQAIVYRSSVDGAMAHAWFYPPQNRDYCGLEGEKPPLLVKTHGGPTGATQAALAWDVQYWTSRGFAVLDVNYGGSTGYGRRYRQRLTGNWGIIDVADCEDGVLFVAAQGWIDPQRVVIRGGSAGGYTTLRALTANTRGLFKAGASYYGVADLTLLARDTHKFESRYLDRLIGPYPEAEALYQARSPINAVSQANTPIIFFQGLQDKVVPPNQAEVMVAALRAKGLAVEYLAFAEEGHGFRQAQNVRTALEAEWAFYARVLGFLSHCSCQRTI